jgi:hypothetical protein
MTAVEWLKEQFLKHELIFDPEIKNFEQHLFNEAIEMEKQQIIAAVEWNYKSNMGEVYYNAVYKKEQK